MRRLFRSSSAAATIAALTLALGACGSDSVTTPTTTGPTQDQIASIGSSVAAEMESAVALMTVKNLENPFNGAARVVGTAPGVRAMVPWSAAANCPTLSPNPPADSDADGVPDSVQFTYTPGVGQCTVQDQSGIFMISGHVVITDPAPHDSGLTLNGTATDFMLAASTIDGSSSISQTRNGSWSVAASDSGVTEAWNVASAIQITGRPNLAITSQWIGSFIPVSGDTIRLGQALPPGDFSASGGLGVNDGTNTFDVTLTTTTPLAYNPAQCAGAATSFSNGEVHAAVTANGKSGYVLVSWASCASPTYAFIATS